MNKRCSLLALIALLLLPFQGSTQTDQDAADSIRIIRGVPGLAYAVFSEDSILEEQVVGYRAFKSKDKISLKDRFHIGTNTIAFTAYIAARLVEAGKIEWTTPLLKLFPEFKKKAFPVYQNITLADLLTSRTRIQPFTTMADWSRIPDFRGNIIARRKAFTFYMLQQKPDMENFLQKKIVFSLAGYIMAASMLEKVTGKAWEELISQYIQKPLKITIHYSWPLLSDTASPAGHWSQGGYFHSEDAHTWVRINPILYPAQEINISMPDYIKFMQENLSGLIGKKAHLSQETLQFIHFGTIDYSMGWNNGSMNDQSFSFHEGISLLFACRAEILKEKHRGILVFCNSGDREGRGAVLDLTRFLEQEYF